MIGTGNSGHDIAQDLYSSGAEVTLAQRSSTLVTNIEPSAQLAYAAYNEGTLEDNDLIATSMPLTLAKKSHVMITEQSRKLDQPLLDGLERVGFKLDYGEGNTGWQFKYLTRGGGYYFNVGCSDLVASGAIRLVQFSDIESFVAEGARMKSGERLAADLIVLATGYKPQEVLVRKLFGDAIAASRRPDLGLWRRPGIAQHVHPHAAARPVVHRRQSRAVPDQFEISGTADQGDRGRVAAAGSAYREGRGSGRVNLPSHHRHSGARRRREPGICADSGSGPSDHPGMTVNSGEHDMPTILGSGEHRYRVVENWAKLPDRWNLTDVASVAVDSKDRIYVFNRGAHPMVVLDRAGNFITSWGEGLFARAHGLHIDGDDNLYCTDDGDHTVRKCSVDGKVLLTIGIPHKPAPFMSGEPFHRCTHTALSPKGEIYVSDGYGNACVHKFTPGGKLIKTWGESGTDPGQFNIVHNIVTDADGFVYVADRENHRVQVFDGNGKYEAQWNNLHRPCALHCCGGKSPNFIVGELGPGMPVNLKAPNLGPRLTIVDAKGKRIARLGGENGPGLETGKFLAPHGIALDSKGDIYVGEVGVTNWKTSFPDTPMPAVVRCLQKLERI